jgi:hypothetical protein
MRTSSFQQGKYYEENKKREKDKELLGKGCLRKLYLYETK